jgi:hypothetical protein
MKLCKAFAEIETPREIKGRVQSEWYWKGIHAANNALPVESIRLAILLMNEKASAATGSIAVAERAALTWHADQLRALIPEE